LGADYYVRHNMMPDTIDRRSVLLGGAGLGTFMATGGKANAMNHVAMLGDSIFDNGAYVGGAPTFVLRHKCCCPV
jgi:hypothetical protein